MDSKDFDHILLALISCLSMQAPSKWDKLVCNESKIFVLTNSSTGDFSVAAHTHSPLSHKTHQPCPDDALESNFLSGMTAKNQTTERNLKTKF